VSFTYNVDEIFFTEDSDDSLNTLVLMKTRERVLPRLPCFAMPNVCANRQRVLFLLLETAGDVFLQSAHCSKQTRLALLFFVR